VLCCVFTFSFAQFWTQKANFGGAARRSAMVFSIGTKAYLGLGYNGVFYKDLWEYDPVSDSWNQKADFGGTARFAGVGFSIFDKGYVGTGYDVNNTFNTADFWQYDPVANGWTQVADIPVARRYAVGFSLLGKGYVGTGANDTGYLNDFWQYDPAADSWTQKADFTGDPRYECAGFSVSITDTLASVHLQEHCIMIFMSMLRRMMHGHRKPITPVADPMHLCFWDRKRKVMSAEAVTR
jgi:N-acetylneuraminic acid mutarotase